MEQKWVYLCCMLPSETIIGVIGGGQLGKMLIESALPWNIKYHILDAKGCPASHYAQKHIVAGLKDFEAILELGKTSDVISYEIEHINVDALEELEKQGKKVIPSASVLRTINNKAIQKDFYVRNNIPTAAYVNVSNKSEWLDAANTLVDQKIVAKMASGGYDGKGVQIMDIQSIKDGDIPFEGEAVLEKIVPFVKELAVTIACDQHGNMKHYPVVEMEFHPEGNMVEFLFSPAKITTEIEEKAVEIAYKVAKAFDSAGIFAVELFLTEDGEILVNETAPRPHNSGHHTIEACYTSQYEQLNRILLNMPLGNTDLIMPAAMVNILGAPDVVGKYKLIGTEKALSQNGVYIHLYNKADSKPFRKMGHFTVLDKDVDSLIERTKSLKNSIAIKV